MHDGAGDEKIAVSGGGFYRDLGLVITVVTSSTRTAIFLDGTQVY